MALSRLESPVRASDVADPREVPPSPGTVPLVSKQPLRRHREDAELYSEYRKSGTHPYTLDEIDARITACAADLAATKGTGPVSPPVLRELVATFWHRLFRDVPLSAEQRASFDLELRRAQTEVNIAQENLNRSERRRRNLESEAKRTLPPVTGTILSRPWTILLCLFPGAVVEVLGSTPSLKIAFDIPTWVAGLFAVAISAILILAADQLGNALASAVSRSRRLTAGVAGLLVVVAIAAAGWAVAELAHSRTVNLSRQQQLEAIESAGGETGGFNGFDELTGPGTKADEAKKQEEEAKRAAEEATRRQAQIKALPNPSFGFFVPLSALIMATATLVAFRIEAAREWNERNLGIADAQEAASEHRKHEATLRQRANDAGFTEDRILQEAAAYVEREHGLLTGWIDRFRAEYQRFCALEGCEPRSIVAPPLPDPEEALARLLHQRAGNERATPEEEPPPDGPLPDRDSRDGQRGGPDAGPRSPAAGPQAAVGPRSPAVGPQAAAAGPEPGARRSRSRRSRRRDGGSKAAGWWDSTPEGS